jgi:hypothetical protein
VRFDAVGEVELMTVRNAAPEQCDVEGGTGTDPDSHRIEWHLLHAPEPADAAQAAQAVNRPLLLVPMAPDATPAPTPDLPASGSLLGIDPSDRGIVLSLKPAERGDARAIIVRALLLPGPLTLQLPSALVGRPIKRVDALERELDDLGITKETVTLDRERFGAIATVKIEPLP